MLFPSSTPIFKNHEIPTCFTFKQNHPQIIEQSQCPLPPRPKPHTKIHEKKSSCSSLFRTHTDDISKRLFGGLLAQAWSLPSLGLGKEWGRAEPLHRRPLAASTTPVPRNSGIRLGENRWVFGSKQQGAPRRGNKNTPKVHHIYDDYMIIAWGEKSVMEGTKL